MSFSIRRSKEAVVGSEPLWVDRRSRHRHRLALSTMLCMALAGAMATTVLDLPYQAEGPSAPGTEDPAEGRDGTVEERDEDELAADAPVEATWPSAETVRLELTGGEANAALGGLPIRVHATGAESPESVELSLLPLDTAEPSGISGVMLAATASAGRFEVEVDYTSLAGVYGGGYGSRLAVWSVPDCAEAPQPGCASAAQPLYATNNGEASTLTFTLDTEDGQPGHGSVPTAATESNRGIEDAPHTIERQAQATTSTSTEVVALAATDASAGGAFSATPLAPSSSWTQSGASGAFNWSYPIEVPPVIGDMAPSVNISYSSQEVDGRTAATNNQGSWIGEGFSYEPGYIERRYRPCEDDGHGKFDPGAADLCWAWDNATIMLNGVAGELIRDGSTWRISSDVGAKVERLTGAGNGDNDGEYWKVTTTDGVQYYFGRHRLPGYATGDTATNSAWTAPVFGDDAGEPCYNATFKDAFCDQAWRWNLDWVVDPTGAAMSYYYTKETNYYARHADTTVNGDNYNRGGYLKSIQYGLRSADAYTVAPARILFTVAERCLEYDASIDCSASALNNNTAVNWPDVPWDLNCPSAQPCAASEIAPTFWTRKRLTKISTQVNSAAGYVNVDSWSLGHSFVSNGDTTRSLWLQSITRTGHTAATSVSLPATELLPVQRPNRVDVVGDSISPLIRPRLATIYTDLGGQIDVSYTDADCAPGSTPSPSSNTRRCFPQIWQPASADGNITDWFHKYLVNEVTVSDRVAESPDQVTRYDYQGGAAWRKAEPDGITPTDELTWNDWRGYATITVTGAPNTTLATRTDHTYFRGMNGDKDASGNTRTVTVTDALGNTHTDYDELSGAPLDAVVYNGADIVSRTSTDYWRRITAEDTHTWGTISSAFVRENTVRVETALENGTWLRQTADTDYDNALGRVLTIDDFGGPGAADNRCIRYEYADNSTTHLLAYPKRVETVAVDCATTPDRASAVIADTRTLYDGLAYGAAPTEGLVTSMQELKSHTGTTASYLTTASFSYDDFARVTTLSDSLQTPTSITYTDANGRNIGQTTTNVLGHAESNTFSPDRHLATTATDANGRLTEMTHDALGRLTEIWLDPQDSSVPTALPYQHFSYDISENAPPTVTTKTLANDWTTQLTTVTILDGWARTRQIQTDGPFGGRLVEDTIYDQLGRTSKINESYYAAGAPSRTLMIVDDGETDIQLITGYDRAGRVTSSTTATGGIELWTERFAYGGDRTHYTPVEGGIATTSISDARGRLTEQRQYPGAQPTGVYESTKFEYNPREEVEKVTDPAGNVWTFDYNQRGHLIVADDPDTGATTFTYDTEGRLTSTTDAANRTVTTVYDKLGRVTATWQGAETTGKQLTRRVWDTYYKGYETGSVAYGDGVTTTILYGMRDWDYQVQSTKYTISGTNAGSLAGSYTFTTSFNLDGSVLEDNYAPVAGLPADAVTYMRDKFGRITRAFDGDTPYATDINYRENGQFSSARYPVAGTHAEQTFYYDDANRLTRNVLEVDSIAGTLTDTTYDFDDVGNLQSIIDSPNSQGAERQAQCFTYDWQRRLTEAWTTATAGTDSAACAGGPENTGIAGAAPYWEAWDFDSAGNRTRATQRTAEGTVAIDETYTYGAGEAGPHSLTAVTDAATNAPITAFGYDATGNTTTINRNGQQQTLTWGPTGSLATLTTVGTAINAAPGSAAGQGGIQGQTHYVYDADGNRIMSRDSNGATLFLPSTEVRYDAKTNTLAATRYLALPGGVTLTKTSNSSGQLQFPDHHGTGNIAIDRDTGELIRLYRDPYGVKLSEQSITDQSWLGNRGFVGGTVDPTGLTHLGAREYDPATGRFISRDPVLDFTDTQQLNGYAYSRNNPVTWTDPNGLENYTFDHHLTTLISFFYLRKEVLARGGDPDDITTEYPVPGGSKDTAGGKGSADLVWIDEDNQTVYVWEVKAAGVASNGTAEVEAYMEVLEDQDRFDGYSFELGFNLYDGGSIFIPDMGPGLGGIRISDYVNGVDTGVIQYDKERDGDDFHTTRPYKVTPALGMQRLKSKLSGNGNITVNHVLKTGQSTVSQGTGGKTTNNVSGRGSSESKSSSQKSASRGRGKTGPGRSTGRVRPGGSVGGRPGGTSGRPGGISAGGISGGGRTNNGRARGGGGIHNHFM